MQNKKLQKTIPLLCSLICIGAGLFIYFTANTILPNTTSSRLEDFNWLLNHFGKTGTSILFALPGLIMLYIFFKPAKTKA